MSESWGVDATEFMGLGMCCVCVCKPASMHAWICLPLYSFRMPCYLHILDAGPWQGHGLKCLLAVWRQQKVDGTEECGQRRKTGRHASEEVLSTVGNNWGSVLGNPLRIMTHSESPENFPEIQMENARILSTKPSFPLDEGYLGLLNSSCFRDVHGWPAKCTQHETLHQDISGHSGCCYNT